MAGEQTFNLNFVKEIEKYPCLYNYTLIAYSFKDVTDKAWTEVGKAVNLSVSECKERWKNLRAVYVRHKKQAKNGTATRKPYYLEEAMEFTLPYIKTLNTTGTGNNTAPFEVVYDEQDEDISQMNNAQSPPSPGISSPSSPQLYQSVSKLKRRNEDDSNEAIQDFYRTKISKVQGSIDPQKEANTLFLLSLLPDLNQMSLSQIRTFKRRVLDLIDEILSVANVKIEPQY